MGAGGNDHSKLVIKSDNMHSGWTQKVVSLLTKLGRGAGVWLPLDPWPMVSEDINNIGKLKAYIHYPQITVSVKTKWNNISFVDRALYVCLIFQYSFSTRFLFQKCYEMFLYQVHSTFAGGSKIRKFQPSGREGEGYDQNFIHVYKGRGLDVKVMIFSLRSFELILHQIF